MADDFRDLPSYVKAGIARGMRDLEAGRIVPLHDDYFEELEAEPHTPSQLSPEGAMVWVLYDHEYPELGISYDKHEQAREIMRALDAGGYKIVRKTDGSA